MSEIEKKLQKYAKDQSMLDLDTLPKTIVAKLIKSEFKEDARANECLYFTLREKATEGKVMQKYGASLFAAINDAIIDVGGWKNLENYLTWEKRKAGRAINDRYYPTKKA